MDLQTFAPDDRDSLLAWAAVRNAVMDHDSPWEHRLTERSAHGMVAHGWDGEPATPFLGTVDGEPVAAGELHASERDNLHSAWLTVEVHPEHRGRGHGRALLTALEDAARSRGRTVTGLSAWDVDGLAGFATAHGYEQKGVGVNRRQHLDEIDHATVDRLHDEALAASSGYELVRYRDRSPDDQLEALAVMASAINDAPRDDLDVEDEVFDGARIRAYEEAQLARGYALYRLVARHRDTGELAGQTVVAVDLERPYFGDQHDTSVVAAHRGHKLGALLKTGMVQWLREEQPQLREIDTWNAESNGFMIGVNEALGYRVMGRGLNHQKTL